MGADRPTVTLCLLNFNGAKFVDRCLAAVRALDPAPTEIVVVDNASGDGSAATLAAFAAEGGPVPVRFVPAGSNRGYAGGHNLGARHARGDLLAFLNITCAPDVHWLDVVPWIADHPDVAFVQPAIFHADDPDRLESLGTLLDPWGGLRVLGRDRRARPGATGTYVGEALAVLGAAFVARRAVFEALGGFDEQMFMYFEETDLCWRGWLARHRTVGWYVAGRGTGVRHAFHGTHPPGFDPARFFEPNRTLTLVRNLEGRHLWHVGRNVATVVAESARRPGRIVRYLATVVDRLPAAAAARRRIQATRVVPDSRLFGLRPPPALDALFVAPPA